MSAGHVINGGERSLEQRVGDLEDKFESVLATVGDQTEAVRDLAKIVQTERAAWDLRIQEMLGHVKLVTEKADLAVVRAEYAVNKAFGARDASHDAIEKVGHLATDQKRIRAHVQKLKETVGEWPTSPDDTGSGLARRVASQHDIDAALVAKALAPSTPPPPPKRSTIPPALVTIWKRTRTHRRVAAWIAGSFGILWAIVQALIAARAGH